MDHPKKTRPTPLTVHSSKQEVSTQMQDMKAQTTKLVSTLRSKKPGMNKLVTSKEQILTTYRDVFEGISIFAGPPYHKQVDPSIMLKQTPCRPVPVHLKEAFKKEVDKMLKAGIIKPVHEVTPWRNSFILIEGKDQPDNLKLHICLDPANLNKADVREPYHFKASEDTAHIITNSCDMTVCDFRKGYWHHELSFLTTFNMELGRF